MTVRVYNVLCVKAATTAWRGEGHGLEEPNQGLEVGMCAIANLSALRSHNSAHRTATPDV